MMVRREATYTVHAKIVPDAVLPTPCLAVRSLVGIRLEPGVDIP